MEKNRESRRTWIDIDTYHRKWTLTLFDTVWLTRRWSISLTPLKLLWLSVFKWVMPNRFKHVNWSTTYIIIIIIYNLYHHSLTFEFIHCLFSSLFPWWNMVKHGETHHPWGQRRPWGLPEAPAVSPQGVTEDAVHRPSAVAAWHGYARLGRHGTFLMKRWQHMGFLRKT